MSTHIDVKAVADGPTFKQRSLASTESQYGTLCHLLCSTTAPRSGRSGGGRKHTFQTTINTTQRCLQH